MRANNDLDPISLFKKCFECIDVGAGRIANHQAGCQMNHFGAVFYHLVARVFDVAAGTPIARCKANQFNFGVRVYAESAFFVPHGPEAFSTRTAAIAITDNYTQFRLWIHFKPFRFLL
jgi:hypothetical protein